MRRLIIAADDFGLAPSVNEGIVRSFTDGIVTSVNFMPTGGAFDDARRRAVTIGLKEGGAHLALTETAPLLPARDVPTLVTAAGRFRRHYGHFFLALLAGRIDRDQIYAELKAQLEAVVRSGITVTNLSSHEHIHMVAPILEVFVKLAKEYDVPAIRIVAGEGAAAPFSLRKAYKDFAIRLLEPAARRMLRGARVRMPDHFRGLVDSGRMTAASLARIIPALDEGVTELVAHPGFVGPEVVRRYAFHRGCEAELAALVDRRIEAMLTKEKVELITYGAFVSQ